MAFDLTSLIKTHSQQPRMIGDSLEQTPFDEDQAAEDLKAQVRGLQSQYNAKVAQVGDPPQRSDFGSQADYESAHQGWAWKRQAADAGLDIARQSALNAHNQVRLAAGLPAIVVPPWKSAKGPLPEPERPDVIAQASAIR
jgi:hypothetical protein